MARLLFYSSAKFAAFKKGTIVRVLVTGATGFVGSHVVDELLLKGYDVSYLARPTSNHRWLTEKNVTLRQGSLYNGESLRTAVADADAIIHVAGQISGKNEADFYRGNVTATANLLTAIQNYRPTLQRFVHISSGAVNGPSESLDKPATEDDKMKPLTAYGRTKAKAEEIVNQVKDVLPITIVRPPVVYGPRDEATLSFFKLVHKGFAPLIGYDDKYVSMIHVRDLSRGIVECMNHPAAVGNTYFITSEESYSWQQIANVAAAVAGRRKLTTIRIPHPAVLAIAGTVGLISKLFSKPSVLNYEKGQDIIQRYWTSSGAKARKELGFKPAISLQDGVEDTMTWYETQRWL